MNEWMWHSLEQKLPETYTCVLTWKPGLAIGYYVDNGIDRYWVIDGEYDDAGPAMWASLPMPPIPALTPKADESAGILE